MRTNQHTGKVAVLCLAPRPGLGVTNEKLRASIGEERLTMFQEFRRLEENGL